MGYMDGSRFVRDVKKKYPPEYAFDECEICGTRIIKKRIKKGQ